MARPPLFRLCGAAAAAALVWPTINGVQLIGLAGQWQTMISAPGTSQVLISVTLGAQTATWEMWMENIYIDHTVSGQDGLLLDNTAMKKKLNCYLRDVGGDADSASDKMLTTVHGDADNAIRVYWSGDNGGVAGVVSFTGGNDGDRLHIDGVELAGGLATSATSVALDIVLKNCTVLHEGITGGDAAQTLSAVNCFSDDDGTFAPLDASDVAGSKTASIVPDFSE